MLQLDHLCMKTQEANATLRPLVRLALVAAGAASIGSAAFGQVSFIPALTPFTDIRVTGTPITPISDDSETILPFDLLGPAGWAGNRVFGGGVGVLVGNNGGIIWNPILGQADQVGFQNAMLPGAPSNSIAGGNGNGLRQFVAVFWDDLLTSASSPATELDWQVIDGDLIVQWSFEDNFDAIGPGRITFQSRFYSQEHVQKFGVAASFIYEDTLYSPGLDGFNDGASTTIGYNGNGVGAAPGVALYSFNAAAVAGYSEAGNGNLPSALNLVVPAPSAAGLSLLAAAAASRRRRPRLS